MKEINFAYKQIMSSDIKINNNNEKSDNKFNEEESEKVNYDQVYKYYQNIFNSRKINVDNLDPFRIYFGDVYKVKYKPVHDFFAPFEEQVIYKKVEENAILYEVGFDEYLNFSKLGVLNLIINGNFIDLDANKKNRVLGDFINLLLVILLLITW